MKFTGKGLLNNIKTVKISDYTPLTVEDLEKFLRTINRHKLRDEQGRFKKKPIKMVLQNAYYKYTGY